MENFKEALEIIKKIEDYGFKAYIVGGAVRDHLLGLESFDIDIATSMPIELIKKHFDVLDNGSDYLSVTIKAMKNSYEITNFRRDISYKDHRHPEVILVDDFKTDTNRRDFTINALAYDKSMRLIDYHNGLVDLNDHLIRAIGNPYTRLDEDALRILRGLYLASKLNFSFEEETLKAIIDKKKLLASLSSERIFSYFYRIANEKYKRGIDYINTYRLFEFIPTYEKWLSVAFKGLNKSELIYSYFIKYRSLPLNLSYEKRICKGLDNLINDNFSIYSLYKNKASYMEARKALLLNGYDVNKYDSIIESFIIKNDNELALSKKEIASYFIGKDKSMAISHIIKGVLEGNISNTREDILEAVRRF